MHHLGETLRSIHGKFEPRSVIWHSQLAYVTFKGQEAVTRKSRNFWSNNSLCIFKTKASRGTKLNSSTVLLISIPFTRCQKSRINRSEFYEWLFGPENFHNFRETGPRLHALYSVVSNERSVILLFKTVLESNFAFFFLNLRFGS